MRGRVNKSIAVIGEGENEWLKNGRIKIGYNHAVRDGLSVQLLEGIHQMNYIFRQ
ncbi:hypothetical protein [Bacteroides ihuae]|uniref:hypothetical protein n=1 Tax=Bacteroides ihuae TaxID=1852362 RepID=UPI0013563265|nr:hypothetical protein [Bacteroides ihuae]